MRFRLPNFNLFKRTIDLHISAARSEIVAAVFRKESTFACENIFLKSYWFENTVLLENSECERFKQSVFTKKIFVFECPVCLVSLNEEIREMGKRDP